MKKIAFLGIGAMGERIASNLIDAGYSLQVWNRTPAKCLNLVNQGATQYDTPRKAVKNADIAIAMVRDDEASRQVWLDKTNGAIYGLQPNTIVLEFSTLTPNWCVELAKEIERCQCHFLDAPVVGSRPQAEAKALIHLVGGKTAIFESVRDFLEASSNAIYHTGDLGTAMKIKLAINALFGIQVAALAEVLGVLEKSDVEIDKAIALLSQMPITSPALKAIGSSIQTSNYAPLFPIDLVEKDFRYGELLGESVGANTPVISSTKHIYQKAQNAGCGNENIAAVARLFIRDLMK